MSHNLKLSVDEVKTHSSLSERCQIEESPPTFDDETLSHIRKVAEPLIPSLRALERNSLLKEM
jgi:hypothetical protein